MNLLELKQKKGKEKIVMLTAYDYQVAKIVDKCAIDLILVGDSVGMVVAGYPDTKKVTMRDMLYHTSAVVRGVKKTPVIADMPINTYSTPDIAIKNAQRFINAGAMAVKVEGCKKRIIEKLLSNSIPVMGHLGLLPQSALNHKYTGKNTISAEKIFQEAIILDRLGVFAIVLECIPWSLAKKITEYVSTATIGIGAGKYCDGQVLVINDLLGMDNDFQPKFAKRYTNLSMIIKNAVMKFRADVKSSHFPDKKYTIV